MFFPVDKDAPQANNVIELKSLLVRGRALSIQMKLEEDNQTEPEMQAQLGITATKAQWNPVFDDIVTLLSDESVTTYIKSVG